MTNDTNGHNKKHTNQINADVDSPRDEELWATPRSQGWMWRGATNVNDIEIEVDEIEVNADWQWELWV